MLNQIIYTRCLPYRDLKRNGQVVRGDGFGVFSLSPEVFNKCSIEELTYINSRLAIPNAAKENAPIGLFNSYEYVLLPSGQGVLTYEVARPLCKEPRKSGKLHRGGNFIKQSLIGLFSRRVTDLIKSDIWDAYKISENEYYMDDIPNPEPPMLTMIDECAVEAGIDTELVDRFVSNGREKLVQSGISFIFRELDKPESERKVLLIKDEPENVNLWILAILRGFPERIANMITFSTNMSRLGAQTDSLLFYYTDNENRMYFIQNQAVELTRHPYCMIVGYHPADVFCANIRQNVNSNFYILDGNASTTTIPDSYNMSAAFCTDSVLSTKEYRYFIDEIFAPITERVSSDEIDIMYGAYNYILLKDVSKWAYSKALQQLRILSKYGAFKNNELSKYLIEKVLPFIEENFRNEIESGFGLSASLWAYTEKTGECGNVLEILTNGIWNQYKAGYDIAKIWRYIKSISNIVFYRSLVLALFSDDLLPGIYNAYSYCEPKSAAILFEMFDEKLQLSGEGEKSILNDDEKFNFTLYAINAARLSSVHAGNCLMRINSNHELFIEIATLIAKNFEEVNSAEAYRWWEVVTESAGESVLSLCEYLIKASGVQMIQIEQLLCSSIIAKKAYDEDICRAFINSKKCIQSDDKSGEYLFSTLIAYAGTSDYSKLIRNIRRAGLEESVERKLFLLMDNKLGIPAPGIDNAGIAMGMGEWAMSLHTGSIFYICYQTWHDVVSEKNEDRVENVFRRFVGSQIPYRNKFIQTQWYSDIFEKSRSFKSGVIHMLMMCFFSFESPEEQRKYIQWFIRNVLKKTEKRELINTMLSISDALCYEYSIPNYNKDEVNAVRKDIETSFIRELIPYYNDSMFRQVEKNKNFDYRTKGKMTMILREVDDKKPIKEHRGILGSLFKR